ncbi:MAG: hypothetical protein AAF548_03960 [Actinomycetota bacterium]
MDATTHVTAIGAKAAADGFRPLADERFTAAFHRRKFMISRFGLVDTLIAVRVLDAPATRAFVERTQADAVEVALANKTRLPRGAGSAVEVFAIVVSDGADTEAIDFVQSSMPTQWSCFTMSALIHGSQARAMYEGRKLFGAAYIGGLKSRLAELIS